MSYVQRCGFSLRNILPNLVHVHVEALFGRAPFASRSYAELEEKIRSNQPIEVVN